MESFALSADISFDDSKNPFTFSDIVSYTKTATFLYPTKNPINKSMPAAELVTMDLKAFIEKLAILENVFVAIEAKLAKEFPKESIILLSEKDSNNDFTASETLENASTPKSFKETRPSLVKLILSEKRAIAVTAPIVSEAILAIGFASMTALSSFIAPEKMVVSAAATATAIL